MSSLKVQDLPIDESVTLRATKILYLDAFQKHASRVLDLTSQQLQHSFDGDITPAFRELAHVTLKANTTTKQAWHLRRTQQHLRFNTRVTAFEPNQTAQVAYVDTHVLSYGASHIYFSPDSPHCSHEITLKPIAVMTRSQSFIKDSANYIWERTPSKSSSTGSGRLTLYEAIGRKKIEVARYASANSKFDFGGLLVLEEREVDALVAILTLIGVLAQNDAFYMPGLDLVGKQRSPFPSR